MATASENEMPEAARRNPMEITMKQLVDKIYNDLETPGSMSPENKSDLDHFLSNAEGLHFNGVNHPVWPVGNLKIVYNDVIQRLQLPNARDMFTNFGDNATMKKLAIKNTICNVAGINCPVQMNLSSRRASTMDVVMNGGMKKRIRSKSRRKKSSKRKSYMKKKLHKKNKRKTKRSKLKH